jgi:hypothetical protein
MENIIFGQIHEEDLQLGFGTDAVVLPDSSTQTLHRIGLHTFAGMYSVKDFGAIGDGINDDTAAIQACINAAGANSLIWFPPGTYKTTSQVTVANNRVFLKGAGPVATQLLFAPTANGTCLAFDSGQEIFTGGISGIGFFSNDSTYVKVALNTVQTAEFYVEDIVVGGSVVHGGTQYWSDATNSSIGIQTNGHEATDFNRISIAADNPIYIGKNPNSTIDADHFHFRNCNLIANQNHVITCQDNIFIQHMLFDGYQAWVKGFDGFHYISNGTGAAVGARVMVRFDNVGREQVEDATHYCFRCNLSGGDAIQLLTIRNAYGPTLNEGGGLFLRGINGASIDNYWYIGNGTALNADATCADFMFNNWNFSANGGTLSTTGFTGFFVYRSETQTLGLNTFSTSGILNLGNLGFIRELNSTGVSRRLIGIPASDFITVDPDAIGTIIGETLGGGLRINHLVPATHLVSIPYAQNYSAVNSTSTDTVAIVGVGNAGFGLNTVNFDAGQNGSVFGSWLAIYQYLEGVGIADPANAPVSHGRLYFHLNGGGKMELKVRWPTGAAQVIATEP